MTIEEKVKNDLRLLALTDFDKFIAHIGLDLTTLVICERRRRDNSLRQIAIAMQMPVPSVQNHCRKCPTM